MSAHFTPVIFLCRMAVYAAALLVLATARLPEQPTAEAAALSRRAEPQTHGAAEPPSRRVPSRMVRATVLVRGVLADARRPPWR